MKGYRPYRSNEGEVVKTAIVKNKTSAIEYEILFCKDTYFCIGDDIYISAEHLLRDFTFTDGSPCGISDD